ncbi:acetyl-CoA acetyltransferase [Nocardia thraciensis]
MSNEVSPTGRAELPPRTPVIVGVGQVSERIGEPGYRGLSAADLAVAAVRAAVADTGGDAEAVIAALDTVVAIRAFDDSSAFARPVLGAPDNVARAVAGRVGAHPRRAILGPTGGQGPQQLVTELCGAVADEKCDAAVLFGAEAISTVRDLAGRPAAERPDFGERVDGSLEDRGYGIEGMTPAQAVLHRMVEPLVSYSVLENARRARVGASRPEYARAMGALFSRFSAVAARNPHAAAPVAREAAELIEESDRNRRVTDVYTRLLIAREQVNQGAAVLIMSLATARRLAIPGARMVFLAGHADLTERELLVRPDLSRSPAAVAAARSALDMAGVSVDRLAAMDLYSCFPIAVFNICDGLGLDPDDPRGLTATGGLPYFGGPGNNYSTHAIAEIVARVRDRPGSHGMVVANGGVLSKHSVGVYTTAPTAWRRSRAAIVQAELDDVPGVPVAVHADGWGTVESFVVRFDRDGSRLGIVLGRLDDGRRFLANTLERDDLLDALTGDGQPIGERVFVRSTDAGNRVAFDRERLDRLLGRPTPGFRDDYSQVLVTRSGHVLEVTIDRAETGNALNAAAQRELDEIFTAFQHDDDLWVAVLCGAGEEAFCTGHDLGELASPMQLLGQPRSGFGGLVARELTKPVIAAVNGRADGGGLELVLACHLVVADDAASFALPDTGIGQAPGPGVLIRLPRTVGRALAHDMIVTGRRIDAGEAVAAGLVARLAPTGKAPALAREMAADVVARSPVAIRAALSFMARTDPAADPDGPLGRPADLLDDLIPHRDPVEGLTALREGRKPQWHTRFQ